MAKNRNIRKLTPLEIGSIRTALLLKRAELLGDVNSMEDEALRRDCNNSSHTPIHLADLGSDNHQIEHTLDLVGNEKKTLFEIDDALDRIEKGLYGNCQRDGLPIPKARLKAIPWTRFCVTCAMLSDKKHVARYCKPGRRLFLSTVDVESNECDRYKDNGHSQIIDEEFLEDTG